MLHSFSPACLPLEAFFLLTSLRTATYRPIIAIFPFFQHKKRPATMGSADDPFTLLPAPIKGDADWRDFRTLRLSNGVTICLVHDPQAKTTAAGATIAAGAAYDPRSLSGLAHFCEHMCFLGSKKYPGKC